MTRGRNQGPPRGQTHYPWPPAEAAELEGFPSRSVSGNWFRAHVDRGPLVGRDHGCWWFSSSERDPAATGRFDLPRPEGTCSLATAAEAAIRERVGTQLRMVGREETVTATALTTSIGPVVVSTAPIRPTVAANLAVKPAQRWIDRSLSVGTGIYSISQAWAVAFRTAGFEAIAHEPRFTLGARVRKLAVFGPSGRPSPRRWTSGFRPARQVLEDHGVRIVDRPSTAPPTLAPETPPPAL